MDKNYKNTGLIGKYNISKVDGTPIDENARYFVLRYDKYQKDEKHMMACRNALLKYADEISEHLPVLSEDLRKILTEPN